MGDSPLAFRHGPKSVLDDNTLVVMYLSNDPYTRAYDLDLLDELRRSHGAASTCWRSRPTTATRRASELALAAARLPPTWPTRLWRCPLSLFAQLLALHSSMALGLTADNPFPSGEVNRVVQGVRIHAYDQRRRSTATGRRPGRGSRAAPLRSVPYEPQEARRWGGSRCCSRHRAPGIGTLMPYLAVYLAWRGCSRPDRCRPGPDGCGRRRRGPVWGAWPTGAGAAWALRLSCALAAVGSLVLLAAGSGFRP